MENAPPSAKFWARPCNLFNIDVHFLIYYPQFAVNNNPPHDVIVVCSSEQGAILLMDYLQNIQFIGGRSVDLTTQIINFSPRVGLSQAKQEILGGC